MLDSAYVKSIGLLSANVLKNLSTLKYLAIYRDYADVQLVEETHEWAVLAAFPTNILSYDTATYPKARTAIFLNGSNDRLKHKLLDSLRPDSYVLRLNENLDLSVHGKRFAIYPGNAYVSFTGSRLNSPRADPCVETGSVPTSEAVEMFGRNGYTHKDTEAYFDRGARWFGLRIDGSLASACFVFQNYEDIWEIAGVHTIDSQRRRGYATIVVRCALSYLLQRRLTPRYEAEEKNVASTELARKLGMKGFLTIRHYLFEPQKARAESQPVIVATHGIQELRRLTSGDAGAVLDVYRQCEDFLALGPDPRASMEMVLADMEASDRESGVSCGIYTENGKMIGVVDFVPSGSGGHPHEGFISLLMIARPFRGRGLGAEVVKAIEDEVGTRHGVTRIRTAVQVNNPDALRFWQRNGYRVAGAPELQPDRTNIFHLEKAF